MHNVLPKNSARRTVARFFDSANERQAYWNRLALPGGQQHAERDRTAAGSSAVQPGEGVVHTTQPKNSGKERRHCFLRM